jgi:hypothetical protein
MPIETARFSTYESYLAHLQKTDEAPNALFIADHEREHFEAALRLGYRPIYALQHFTNDPSKPFTFAIDFIEKEPTSVDMIAICLAPREPSEGDLELVAQLRRSVA